MPAFAPSTLQRKPVRAVLATLCGAALAGTLAATGALERLEGILFDQRTRAHAGLPADGRPPIAVILLDQASLDWARTELGWGWPWYREAYARLLRHCVTGGAVTVAFDVLYTEPSVHGVEDDQAFADALGSTESDLLAAVPAADATTVAGGADPRWFTLPAEGLRPPFRSFAPGGLSVEPMSTRSRSALANGVPDGDGVFRHALPWAMVGGRPVPSLGLAAHEVSAPGSRPFPFPTGAPVKLRHRGTAADYRPFSAAAVLQSALQLEAGEPPAIPPETFRGKRVFIAFSAPGLMDLRPTPLSPKEPGVMTHVTLLHNLLDNDWMRAPSPGLTRLALLASSLAAAVGMTLARRASAGVAGLLLLTALPVAAAYPLHAHSIDLPAATLALAALASSVAALALNYATEGRQKAFIKGAFAHYLSPEVIDRIIASPDQLRLGGERRELSMFFSDLEGFSGFSERMSPEDLIALLNEYMGEMTDIILAAGGTLDKYIGDAIVAFWNAPLPQPDHAGQAVRAALACQARLDQRRAEWRARFGVDLRMRIGINTGEVVVGNMGSARRFDYTMLGDAANLASRLEGSNKVFHTFILISETTRAALPPAIACRELGQLRVVGREQPLTVFEPLAEGHRVPVDAFAAALAALRGGRLEEARDRFRALCDPAAEAYAEACADRLARGEAWDGVWRPTSK